MPRNKLTDLNDILFEQLENVVTAEGDEEIKMQISKAKVVASLASNIIDTANIALEVSKIKLEYGENLKGSLIPQLEYHE